MLTAVGIQTCPGRDVSPVLTSLARAGWTDISVFAEPGSSVPFSCPVTSWGRQMGDWGNWFSSLFCLYTSNPEAQAFLMCEDDVSLCRNVRRYVESVWNRLPLFAALSLYTPTRQTTTRSPCWTNEGWRGDHFWGGQALLFPRSALADFLRSDTAFFFREIDSSNGHKDQVLGRWCREEGRPLFCHTPSLAQHLPGKSLTGNRSNEAASYPGDDFDAAVFAGNTVDFVRETPMRLVI